MKEKFPVQAAKPSELREALPKPSQSGIVQAPPTRKFGAWPLFIFGAVALWALSFPFYAYSPIFIIGAYGIARRFLRRASSVELIGDATGSTNSEEESQNLRRVFAKLSFSDHVSKEGERGGHILTSLLERRKKFHQLLPAKFSPGEITYDRYFAQGEAAYIGIFRELEVISQVLQSLSGIDLKDLEKRANALKDSDEEKTALLARIKIKNDKSQQLEALFDLLEQGLTAFDHLIVSLAEIKTSSDQQSQQQLEDTFAQLKNLADRAKKYER